MILYAIYNPETRIVDRFGATSQKPGVQLKYGEELTFIEKMPPITIPPKVYRLDDNGIPVEVTD